MKKTAIVIFMAVSLLAGCQATSSTSSQFTFVPADYVTVQAYVEALTKVQNYTLDIQLTGSENVQYSVIYTDTYYVNEKPNAGYGYAKNENHCFRFESYDDEWVAGEVLLVEDAVQKEIWQQDYFSSFADLQLTKFASATSAKYSLIDKASMLTFFTMLQLDPAYYIAFESCQFNVADEKLSFTITCKDIVATVQVKNVMQSKQETIHQLALGGAYEMTEEEVRIRDGFKQDNYSELIVDAQGETIGYTAFTEQYYFPEFTDEYKAFYKQQTGNSIIQQGFIGFDHKTYQGKEYHGIYAVTAIETQYMLTYYMMDNPDVTSALNYPKNLRALKEFQYFRYDNSYEANVTYRSAILNDFVINYQLGESMSENGYVPICLGYNSSFAGGELAVTFSLVVGSALTGNVIGAFNYYYVDFGSTSSPFMELVLKNYQ